VRRPLVCALLLASLLVGSASAQYGYFGRNKVRDREFDWRILATEHFDIYFYPDAAEVVGGVAEMAEAAWKKLEGDLGSEPVHRIPFILYASGRDFRQTNIYLGFLPEGVGGFAEAARNRVVIPFEGSQPRMWDTTVHELTHVFTFYSFYRDLTGELLNTQLGVPDFWFMEGIAEHEARDWNTDGRMVLRDAVLSENLVRLEQLRYGDYIPDWALYLAYKQGQSAVDFFVERYGAEMLPELVDAIAAEPDRDVSKALEKVVGMDLREFHEEWTIDLKRRYWVELVEGRRPEDFARRVTDIDERYTSYVGPRFSPSGELLAVISNLDRGANVYLLDTKEGEVFERLTYAGEFDYLAAGGATLDFSPSGDALAVVAKEEGWLNVYLVDAITGYIFREFTDLEFDDITGVCFDPEGETLYLSAQNRGQVDLYGLRTGDGRLVRLTDTPHAELYPAASPDGWTLAYCLEEEDGTHLAELDLRTGEVDVLTTGVAEDRYPSYLPDSSGVVFSSDRAGPSNLFLYRAETGAITQLTDSLRDIFNPDVSADGEKLCFNSYKDMTYQVYVMPLSDALERPYEPTLAELAPEDSGMPPIRTGAEIGDLSKLGRLHPWEYDLEIDSGIVTAEYTTGGLFRALGLVEGSDTLGDHRLFVEFGLGSVADLQDLDLDVGYYWMKYRPIYGGRVFNWNEYYLVTDGYLRERVTGGQISVSYPLAETLRAEAALTGYEWAYEYTFVDGSEFNDYQNIVAPGVALVYDDTEWSYWHPVSGVRAKLTYDRPSKFLGSDWEFNELSADLRGYLQFFEDADAGFALRLFGLVTFGGDPYEPVYYAGGAFDLRGYGYSEFTGNNVALGSLELRIPVVNLIEFGFIPGFLIGDIRGVGFFDAGLAWYTDQDVTLWETDPELRFRDLNASMGLGIRWASLGVPIRLDWAWPWDGTDFQDAVFHFTLGYEF
jgi:hypothetical protein